MASRWRWLLVALSLVVLQACIAFRCASRAHYCGDWDAASYYSTARNLAQGRGLLDTCHWHCLGSSAVARPAGDYWPPGWPFLLGQAMRICGTSFESTAYLMATLSLLLPLTVAALVWSWECPLRSAWLAGAMVCCLTELFYSCVMPDVALGYELVTLAGLIVLARVSDNPRALGMAGAFCMLGIWFRGEGFILWMVGAVLLCRRPALLWWGLGGLAVALWHAVYNCMAFGQPIPPPRASIPWLIQFTDLWAFGPLPTAMSWLQQGPWIICGKIVHCLGSFSHDLLTQTPLGLMLAALMGARLVWRERPRARAAVLFLMGIFLLPAVLYPVVANPYRLVVQALPIFCALAAPALVEGFGKLPPAWRVLAVVGGAAYYLIWPWPWRYGMTSPIASYQQPDYLRPYLIEHLGLRADDVVMTSHPWEVSGCLGVRSVMCPWNGVSSVYQSIALYHPRYLLAEDHDVVARFMEESHLATLRFRVRLQSNTTRWVELTY